MAAFDEQSDTVALTTAAARLGYGKSAAYDRAHELDEHGRAWLVQGHVEILRMGGRYRVSKRQLERVLAPLEAAS